MSKRNKAWTGGYWSALERHGFTMRRAVTVSTLLAFLSTFLMILSVMAASVDTRFAAVAVVFAGGTLLFGILAIVADKVDGRRK